MMALFTPAFAHAMDAYTLHVNVNRFITFGNELEETIQTLSFAGNGSRTRIQVPSIQGMEIRTENNQIILTLAHDELSQPKNRIIPTLVQVEGSFTQGKTSVLTREQGKITIRDE
ncbi:MAG: hypothetical protein FJY86_03115 [Candidatus Diapherotrites archaeon]|uniref:Uncharacterized protein n=1 Tax=Candidatus Iainarchaeum sp. TaxID=3101447 RepID=A0A8T4C7X3_9ARCH|nr:hypothetical protein [Candidatus Diapherotrites archaeon]